MFSVQTKIIFYGILFNGVLHRNSYFYLLKNYEIAILMNINI